MLSLLLQRSMPLWITNAAHATRFRRMWGTIPPPLGRNYVPSGARLRQVGHDSATARKVPHFPAESCPTSQRNAAPLQTESVPHFDRNPQLAGNAHSRSSRWRGGGPPIDPKPENETVGKLSPALWLWSSGRKRG